MPEDEQNKQDNAEAVLDVLGAPRPDLKDKALNEDQISLQDAKKQILQERFLWVLGIVVYIDFQFFLQEYQFAAIVVIGIIQIIGLTVFAEYCGVGVVKKMYNRAAKAAGRK